MVLEVAHVVANQYQWDVAMYAVDMAKSQKISRKNSAWQIAVQFKAYAFLVLVLRVDSGQMKEREEISFDAIEL